MLKGQSGYTVQLGISTIMRGSGLIFWAKPSIALLAGLGADMSNALICLYMSRE